MGYEYAVAALAAALAGIGTGLVGLSAATAMVPLLIVLCPTFGGEHGAYMATAIALASDILGSAVTTGIYAKNKKIDLRHSWLFAACIIGMCTVGSIAAYFTHQTVLGGFSLFLCVAIGAIMARGPGDAVAAIVGKRHGRHKLRGRWIEGTKSVEGSVGMAVTSLLCLVPVLLFMSPLPWYFAVVFSLAVAPFAALTELLTKGGWDTVTVPTVSALILSLSMIWF